MKKITLSSLFVLISLMFSAQAIFQEVKYNEKLEPGLVLDLPSKPETVKNTILQKLMETGYKPESTGALFWKSKTINGFYTFKQVTLPELNNQTLDLYFFVETQKQNKNKTKLYMLVSKGYDNFVSPESDTIIYRAARRFLNGFVEETAAYKLNISIEEQKEIIADTERTMKKLKDREIDMIKKTENLNADLAKNKSEQDQLQVKIQEQNRKLEESNLQLKSLKN